jgi:hypothetical protein
MWQKPLEADERREISETPLGDGDISVVPEAGVSRQSPNSITRALGAARDMTCSVSYSDICPQASMTMCENRPAAL